MNKTLVLLPFSKKKCSKPGGEEGDHQSSCEEQYAASFHVGASLFIGCREKIWKMLIELNNEGNLQV
jgi:hypothetical protein